MEGGYSSEEEVRSGQKSLTGKTSIEISGRGPILSRLARLNPDSASRWSLESLASVNATVSQGAL